MEFNKDLIEKLAKAAHDTFCDELRAKGYSYEPETRESDKEHSSLRPYAELSEYEKDKNRRFVRDIPRKLSTVGYILQPAGGNVVVLEFSKDDIEKLARMEHKRWMQETLASKAKYLQTRNKANKGFVQWDELPENERDKDRALVRGIPRILAEAGYVIVSRGK